MKTKKFILGIISLIITITSCVNNNPINQNEVKFSNPKETVKETIKETVIVKESDNKGTTDNQDSNKTALVPFVPEPGKSSEETPAIVTPTPIISQSPQASVSPTVSPIASPTTSQSVSPTPTASTTATTTATPTPEVPASLNKADVTQISFTLSWGAASGATSYKVYKDSVVYADNITGTLKDITGLTAGTTYSMEVSAVNAGGESTKSTALSVTTMINIEMVTIPAGNFTMGDTDANCNGGQPYCGGGQYTIYVNAYKIGKYEVTNAEYGKFIDTGGYNNSSYWTANGWAYKTNNSLIQPHYWTNIRDNKPVVGVSWFEAYAFCKWAGYRLPTEAEWEKAARGTDGRAFPWGNTVPNCSYANFRYNGSFCVGNTTVVGSYPTGVSPYGVMDMTGNVFEWVSSQFQTYPYNATDGRENQDNVDSGVPVIQRSISCYFGNSPFDTFLRCSARLESGAAGYGDGLGFRIAQD